MSRIIRRKLLNNLNSISTSSLNSTSFASGASFSSESSFTSQREEDAAFDIKMRSRGYVLYPAGWFPAGSFKEPVVTQCKNFISEVPGKRGKSNIALFSVCSPVLEQPGFDDIVNIFKGVESISVDFSLIKPGVLSVDRLAFELTFLMSLDRVFSSLAYPLHDPPSTVVRFNGCGIRSCSLKSRVYSSFEVSVLLFIGNTELNPGPKGTIPPDKEKKKKKVSSPKTDLSVRIKEPSKGILHPLHNALQHAKMKMIGFGQNYRCRLRYVIPMQRIVGGGLVNNIRFSTNAYDVDAALGSTAMAYFSEIAAVFSRFRTEGIGYDLTFINNEAASNVQLVHGFSTNLFGSTALGANYGENKYINSKTTIGWKGMGVKAFVKQYVKTVALFGSKQPKYDDLFNGSTTSSTLGSSATGYCYAGCVQELVPVSGVTVSGEINLDLFFNRRNDLVNKVEADRPNSCYVKLPGNDEFKNSFPDDPYYDWAMQENQKEKIPIEERVAKLEEALSEKKTFSITLST